MPRVVAAGRGDVVPPESWRVSLCGFPVGGCSVLVADRAHHADCAVPPVVVVEPVAPVEHDGLGLVGLLKLVTCKALPLQAAEEGLGSRVVEARPDPAHRLADTELAAQLREGVCGVGGEPRSVWKMTRWASSGRQIA